MAQGMGSKTYKTLAIVLKKTKLADKDLIVTMLDESGALFQGVAKGARKPGGSLAGRLELFSTVDVMMAAGRSLDVVCEARLAGPIAPAGQALERSACASPVAELLGLVAQPGLAQPRLFDMARSAFNHIASAEIDACGALAICSASLWKVMGQAGFRPAIATCAVCAGPAGIGDVGDGTAVAFSPGEGGVVCDGCPRPADALLVDAGVLRWCEALIRLRFDDVAASPPDVPLCFEVLSLAQTWARVHVGRPLKSLGFLFTSGLF